MHELLNRRSNDGYREHPSQVNTSDTLNDNGVAPAPIRRKFFHSISFKRNKRQAAPEGSGINSWFQIHHHEQEGHAHRIGDYSDPYHSTGHLSHILRTARLFEPLSTQGSDRGRSNA